MPGPSRPRGIIGGIGFFGAGAAACLTSTGIDLRVYSEVPCAEHAPVTIVVAPDNATLAQRMADGVVTATQSGCNDADGYVGNLELLPAHLPESTSLAVMVRADGQPSDRCGTPDGAQGCIVARRSLGFVPHQQLHARVDLRMSCLNVTCPADQTCVNGQCVSSQPIGSCQPICDEGSLGGDPGDLSGLQSGAPWPMQDRSPNHTSQSTYAGPRVARVAWVLPVGGNVTNPPAIAADGTLYLPVEGTKNCFAINPSGSIRWTTPLNTIGHRTPAIAADGSIYLGTDAGMVVLSPTGSIKRTTPTPSSAFYGGPSIAPNGTTYQSVVDTGVVAYNPTGKAVWTFKGAGRVFSSATFSRSGQIYVGSSLQKSLFAITPTGQLAWSFQTGNQVFASPSIAVDGTIYAPSDDATLYALNPDGSLKWSIATGAQIVGDAAIASDGTVYFGSYDKKLYAVTPAGKVRWTFETGGPIEANPAIGSDGVVYFSSGDGVVYAVAPDGTLVWSYAVSTTPLRMFGGSIGADGTLYIGTFDGRLVAFAP